MPLLQRNRQKLSKRRLYSVERLNAIPHLRIGWWWVERARLRKMWLVAGSIASGQICQNQSHQMLQQEMPSQSQGLYQDRHGGERARGISNCGREGKSLQLLGWEGRRGWRWVWAQILENHYEINHESYLSKAFIRNLLSKFLNHSSLHVNWIFFIVPR